MHSPDASDIARLLKEFGRRAMLSGGVQVKSLSAGSRTVCRCDRANRRLKREIGFEKNLIATIHQTGTYPTLEKMRADVPENVLEMLTTRACVPRKCEAT